jgi:hypothetical protein
MTKTTHDWEWFIYTTYKNGDDWWMVYLLLFYPNKPGESQSHPYYLGCFV